MIFMGGSTKQSHDFGQTHTYDIKCISVTKKKQPNTIIFAECKISVTGDDFRGTSFTKTASGRTCQRWDLDFPHENELNDDPHKMQELGLQGVNLQSVLGPKLCFHIRISKQGQLVLMWWSISLPVIPFAGMKYSVCCYIEVFLQKIIAETQTMRLMYHGVSPQTQTRDGSTVMCPCAQVREPHWKRFLMIEKQSTSLAHHLFFLLSECKKTERLRISWYNILKDCIRFDMPKVGPRHPT